MDYNLFDTVKRIWALGKCAIEIIYLLLLFIIKLLTLMVKLLEKGDLYSKIAMVSILLLVCAVARDVKKKERMRFMVPFLISCKETLQKNLA